MGKKAKEERDRKRLIKPAGRAEALLTSISAGVDSQRMRAQIAGWQAARVAYRLDADLCRALMETDLKVVPPPEALRHLPHGHFMVLFEEALELFDEEDQLHRRFQGVLVGGLATRNLGRRWWTESPPADKAESGIGGIYFGSFVENGMPQSVSATIPSSPLEGITIEEWFGDQLVAESFQYVARGDDGDLTESPVESDFYAQESLRRPLGTFLWQLLLYLASPEPDLRDREVPEVLARQRVGSAQTDVQLYDLGWRVGSALRASSTASAAAGTDASRRRIAHVRRGHWHTYLYGSRSDAERERRLVWVSPTVVNSDLGVPVGVVHDLVTPNSVGAPYRVADEQLDIGVAADFRSSPDTRGRGARAHNALQNMLADAIVASGGTPLSPSPDEPRFDILWKLADGDLMVVEVKSTTAENEVDQLRLGIGQVIDYRWNLANLHGCPVRAGLLVEREPDQADQWNDLCSCEGIVLAWPSTVGRFFGSG